MATQCRLAKRLPDGTYKGVTVHYDGYPSNMCAVLRHYPTDDDANHLVSTNWENITRKFGDWRLEGAGWDKKWTRDRLDIIEEKPISDDDTIFCDDKDPNCYIFETLDDLKENKSRGGYELSVAYTYFYQDGRWYGFYPYVGPMPLVPIEEFIPYLEEHSEEKGVTW